MTGNNDRDKILNHLRKMGSISGQEATVQYSMGSLTKRISELRADGWNIIDSWRVHRITQRKYKRYFFGTDDQGNVVEKLV